MTRRATVWGLFIGVALSLPAGAAEPSGQAIVATHCARCHESGAQGAPRIGDAKAWAPRAEKGLSALSANAIAGLRQMPSHGGAPQLSDAEIKRAVTYMVNRSGGHWTEPEAAARERSGREIVEARCAQCHASGAGGAPRIGDQNAWKTRLAHGVDATVRSAIHGHGSMPPRGGMADLSDAELKAAILYMFNPTGTSPR